AVVLETLISGITELPFVSFVLLMQPIHLAIGLGEGIATAAVLSFVLKSNPILLDGYNTEVTNPKMQSRKVIVILLAVAIVIGGFVSLFASGNPDGLEWSMEGVAGTAELESDSAAHNAAAGIQQIFAFLPDYGFKGGSEESAAAGTSVSGIVGGGITLGLAALTGYLITRTKKKKVKCQS
ncbi:MAG: cbiM2, partial [Bacillota bacterium]|nr:cbiM2 [Bacillota bacterium]